VYNITCLISKK